MLVDSNSLLFRLCKIAIETSASDLHLAVGQPPIVRVRGELRSVQNEPAIVRKDLLEEFKKIVPADVYASYEEKNDKDFSIELPTSERFRIDIYWKNGEPALAARLIPAIIPSLEELEAPESALEFVKLSQGLVLVTGPTGAGKSTLLASMIEHINQNETKHILTLEDPVEFIFEPAKSLISQRELGIDFMSFDEGLKHVFRQDPDIILIGEMRDPETMATAMTLAETGHLVFATLHTNGAAATVERVINAFQTERQAQIRLQLSLVLKGVISQLLIPTADGTLTPVHEVLVTNHAVANIIRDGHTEQLQNIIFTSSSDRMVDLDQELKMLLDEGRITRDTAVEYSRNPKNFKL
ncbi:MAG: PilT/PilU family type 4a pilus ATPase [Patescibacteria group bacterium]